MRIIDADGPKLAVYTHILLFGPFKDEDLIPATRKIYSGLLEVGENLMRIDVGEKVRTSRFPSD